MMAGLAEKARRLLSQMTREVCPGLGGAAAKEGGVAAAGVAVAAAAVVAANADEPVPETECWWRTRMPSPTHTKWVAGIRMHFPQYCTLDLRG